MRLETPLPKTARPNKTPVQTRQAVDDPLAAFKIQAANTMSDKIPTPPRRETNNYQGTFTGAGLSFFTS